MLLGSLRQKINLVRRAVMRADMLEPAMEMVYRDLFVRDLAEIGLPDCYYPVGGAANHSLMYLLLRAVRELQPARVLELGSGQSTLLIDALNAALQRNMHVTTVEHDRDWATRIQRRVSHRIVHAPLTAATVAGRSIEYYAPVFAAPGQHFNLVLIDGPPAHSADCRFARSGCLNLLPSLLAADFMLIVDDAEREGEAWMIERLSERFRAEGREVLRASVAGVKKQTWFSGGAFRAYHF